MAPTSVTYAKSDDLLHLAGGYAIIDVYMCTCIVYVYMCMYTHVFSWYGWLNHEPDPGLAPRNSLPFWLKSSCSVDRMGSCTRVRNGLWMDYCNPRDSRLEVSETTIHDLIWFYYGFTLFSWFTLVSHRDNCWEHSRHIFRSTLPHPVAAVLGETQPTCPGHNQFSRDVGGMKHQVLLICIILFHSVYPLVI